MIPPTIDVIIPTRNRGELTIEAVRSVLAQEHPAVRVWVADDGSDDGSADVVDEAFGTEAAVHLSRAEERVGPAQNRQRAFDATDSEWVALLDSDDVWKPGKLAAQLALADSTDIDVVLCGHEWIDADGRRVKASTPRVDVPDAVSPLLTDNMSAPLIRRSAIERAGGFVAGPRRFSTCEHIDFHVRLSAVARYAAVPEVLVTCRAGCRERASDRMTTPDGARELVDMIEACRCVLATHPTELATLRMRAGARLATAGLRGEAVQQVRLAIRTSSAADRRRVLKTYGPSIARHLVRPARRS